MNTRAGNAWTFWAQVVRNLFHWFGAVGRGLHSQRGRFIVVALPILWLALFFLAPFLIVAKISVAESLPGMRPPYSGLFDDAGTLTLELANYGALVRDPLYLAAYLNSLGFAAVSTLACLLIGFPIAYGIARAGTAARLVLLVLVVLPFWTNSLLRTYAMIGILKTNGLVNNALVALGVIDQPLALLHTNFAVYVGITYNYLPFMILPLVATLMKLDFGLLEAAADLGARPFAAFRRVTLPLAMPGIVAGSLLVFIPSVGEFVIPDLLGGPDAITIGRVLWTEFFNNRDWPLASAVAVAMLALIVIPVLVFEYVSDRRLDADRAR